MGIVNGLQSILVAICPLMESLNIHLKFRQFEIKFKCVAKRKEERKRNYSLWMWKVIWRKSLYAVHDSEIAIIAASNQMSVFMRKSWLLHIQQTPHGKIFNHFFKQQIIKTIRPNWAMPMRVCASHHHHQLHSFYDTVVYVLLLLCWTTNPFFGLWSAASPFFLHINFISLFLVVQQT